ncbi:MAG: DNA-directed RNA polymerase subunit B'', partial [Candidatus Micrarchaeia archaeon]
MNETGRILCRKYFSEQSFVNSDIESFNHFIDYGLQEIIDENKIIEPTIIPNNVESYKIKLNKIKVETPMLVEADGSTRPVYPWEARLRKITYAAAMHLNMSVIIDGVQREEFNAYIGNMPIMLKSKYCHLSKMNREELIEHGEDPEDPGGYFIINGSEKVLVKVEDLAANRFLVTESESGPSKFTGKIFSESAAFRIPHTIEKMKDGIFYITFTRVRRAPVILLIKALGIVKDQDIMRSI